MTGTQLMKTRWMIWLAGVALLAAASGCSPSVSRLDDQDRGEPLVRKAKARASQGDIGSAIRLYAAALDINPKLAIAHLDLALLLDASEEHRDFVRAIYHYQRYLDLRPTSEKRALIEERIRLARQTFAASIVKPERIVEDKAALEKENRELKARMRALEAEVAALRQGGGEARSSGEVRSRPQAPFSPDSRRATPAGATVGPGTRLAAGAADEASVPAARPGKSSYVVQRGDSLSSIAGEAYGDKLQWRKIYEANRTTLGGSTGLKVGQVLVIP